MIENPFVVDSTVSWGHGMDTGTISTLKVLHAVCGHAELETRGAPLAQERADAVHQLVETITHRYSGYADAYSGWVADEHDRHAFELVRLYGEQTALYAEFASRVAYELSTRGTATPYDTWSNEGSQGFAALAGNPTAGFPLIHVDCLAAEPRYAPAMSRLNAELPTWHRRLIDAIVALQKVRPNSFTPEKPVPVPKPTRQPRLEHAAAAALHRYAAGCARAIVLLTMRQTR